MALRMKEIIETTWYRDQVLNEVETIEFKRLKREIENMGLFVSWETRLNLGDPKNIKIDADVTILIPRNMTLN